jgi:hypothetical protein
LVAFYTEHNPDGLGNVDKIIQRYSVPKLKDGMQKKYGSIPDVTVIPKAKGAILATFTFSGDRSDSKPFTMETSMVEADFGGKYLGASGAIMAAAFLPKCT